jgi:anaerobic selenocysteine-containing dehydrogenase
MRSADAGFDVNRVSMNQHTNVDIRHSTCPHDCPSACALDIEVIDARAIGRVRGSKLQTYTAGVVCAKVARYAERIHHAERLIYPMRRTGPKGPAGLPAFPGTRRWTRSAAASMRPSASSAPSRSGLITTPVPWAL